MLLGIEVTKRYDRKSVRKRKYNFEMSMVHSCSKRKVTTTQSVNVEPLNDTLNEIHDELTNDSKVNSKLNTEGKICANDHFTN